MRTHTTRATTATVKVWLAVVVAVSVLAVVPSFAGAQSSGLEVDLPSNSDCRGAAVIAKTTVVEDAAAANMLAEALRIVSPRGDQRCLLDAGLPPDARDSSLPGVPPDGVYRRSAALAAKIYVVGGPAAIPDRWLADQFGVTQFTRIAGADRWRTQENVAAAIIALANGNDVQPYDPAAESGRGSGLAPNGECFGTAVLAKLSIAEERAAANMMAVMLAVIAGDPEIRCLVDVGEPGADRPPTSVGVAEAARATGVYLLGGEAAVPEKWIEDGFDIAFVKRISGADRWATQSAAAQEMIEVVRGGPLPHQFLNEDDVLISNFGDYLVDPALSPASAGTPLESLNKGEFTVTVHYCGRMSDLDSKEEEAAALAEIDKWVNEFNRSTADFFAWQSSQAATVTFVAADDVIRLDNNLPRTGFTSTKYIEKDGKDILNPLGRTSYACYDAMPHRGPITSRTRHYGLVDQKLGAAHGWAYLGGNGVQPLRQHFGSDAHFLSTFAHEMGHAVFWFRHPHEKTVEKADTGGIYVFAKEHNELVFRSELEDDAFDSKEPKTPELCGLMSYCRNRGVQPDRNTQIFLACGQRQLSGWLEGPRTPYEECEFSADASVPDAPGAPRLSVGDGYINVSWTAPADNGAAITQYEVNWGSGSAAVTGTSRRIENLVNGRQYSVTVKARNSAGWGPLSAVATATPRQQVRPPDAPTRVRATPGDSQITVEWATARENGSPVTAYRMLWRCVDHAGDVSGGAWSGPSSARSHTITGLQNGVDCLVEIVADSDAGPSGFAQTTATPRQQSRPPDAPGAPRLSAGDGYIDVSWTAPPDNGAAITQYEVHWGTGSASVTGTSRRIENLVNGRQYSVTVKARNSAGWGPPSAAETATPRQQSRPPDAPGAPRLSAGDGYIDVSWTAPPDNGAPITEYVVGVTLVGATGSGSSWATFVAGTSTSYRIENVVNGRQYSVGVNARNSAGWGPPSAVATATPHQEVDPPGAPSRPRLSVGDGYIDVSWTAPPDNGAPITQYEVSWGSGSASVTGTSFRIENLVNGRQYSVTVRAINSARWGPQSAVATATPQQQARPPDAPGAPRLSAVWRGSVCGVGTFDLAVEWSSANSNGAAVDRYEVRHSRSGFGWPRAGKEVASTRRQTTITGLDQGTTYLVQVRARNSVDWGPWSSASSESLPVVIPTVGRPDAPPAPGLRAADDGAVHVSWNAPDDNCARITQYEVDWSRPGNSGTFTATGTSSKFTTSREGTRYTFKVRAQNSAGWGPWSSSSSVTTPGGEPSIPIITPTIELSRGGPGPRQTSQGVACGANSPDCRYLRMELRDFAAGRYRIHCVHDGFSGGYRPGYFDSFLVTIGQTGSLSVSNRCFINMAKVLGKGVQITVGRSTDDVGTHRWSSNWLK